MPDTTIAPPTGSVTGRLRPGRTLLLALTTLALVVAFVLPGSTTAEAAATNTSPSRIALPDGFAPEGIAIAGNYVYSGSRTTGDIYAADLRTGRGAVFSTGPGTPSLGLKVGAKNQLFVAGGSSGSGRVVDLRTGAILRSVTFTTDTSFVNDEITLGRTVWFTDSSQAQLYGLALNGQGRPTGAFTTLPLSGDWKQLPDVNNANGIATTPDGTALLVINSSSGVLFRVDPRTGVARAVDLGGTTLVNGDGILRQGRTLYVSQNRDNRVAEVALSTTGKRGNVRHYLTSPGFDVPSTIAASGPYLYLPNARFTTTAGPDVSYSINRIRG